MVNFFKNLSLVIDTREKKENRKMKYKCECGNYIYKYVDVTKRYPATQRYLRRRRIEKILNKISNIFS